MTILITGAAGFIGSFLARTLIRRGDNVIGIDNFSNYYSRACKEFNLDLAYLASGLDLRIFKEAEIMPVYQKVHESMLTKTKIGTFNFYETDICNMADLETLFTTHSIDKVLHLAAMAGVPMSGKIPHTYVTTNLCGTNNLLALSKDHGIKNFVFASSSSVYGNREDRKVIETDDVTKTSSIYGATKVGGEVLCHAYNKMFGLNIVINRIFGPIYGPLQRPYGMFTQRVINYIHNDKIIQIWGQHGLETAKDSTYIDDQVDGILKCLDFTESSFEIFNIGTSNPRSIKDIIMIAENALEKKAKIEIVEADKGDVVSSADITKAKNTLNYAPVFDLEEGIKRQVEVFKLMPDWYKALAV